MKKLILLLLLLPMGSFALSDTTTIIGCANTQTLETRPPNNNWNCLLGQNWQNIMLPPASHWDTWKEVFNNNPRMIINRLPIVNFESWFNEYAWNYWAYGYVQTLRSYNIPPEIKPQLEWMRHRQSTQVVGNCSHRSYSEDAMIRCLYNRHYGMLTHYNWYSNKLMVARDFYYDWFEKNWLPF